MAWNRAIPDGSAVSPCAGTLQVTGNWGAISDWWNVEHYNFASSLSGQHKPGVAGVMASGTYAAITASTTPGTGALAWDNTRGLLNIYDSTAAWKGLTEDYYSRVHLSAGAQSMPATAWTNTTFSAKVYDPLVEWTAATDTLRTDAEGYYWIHAEVRWPAGGNYEKAIGIYKDGTRIAQAGGSGTHVRTLEVDDVVYCAANALIDIYLYNGHTSAVSIELLEMVMTRLS